jgi:hypothetical protein
MEKMKTTCFEAAKPMREGCWRPVIARLIRPRSRMRLLWMAFYVLLVLGLSACMVRPSACVVLR